MNMFYKMCSQSVADVAYLVCVCTNLPSLETPSSFSLTNGVVGWSSPVHGEVLYSMRHSV